jgi:hypothetical protein
MCTRGLSGVARATGLVLCLEKMGEVQTGREQREGGGHGYQKTAAVQIAHGFDFSNTAENQHSMMPHHFIQSVT